MLAARSAGHSSLMRSWMVGWIGMLAARSAGHSSLINPISRNSVDRTLPQWANGSSGPLKLSGGWEGQRGTLIRAPHP